MRRAEQSRSPLIELRVPALLQAVLFTLSRQKTRLSRFRQVKHALPQGHSGVSSGASLGRESSTHSPARGVLHQKSSTMRLPTPRSLSPLCELTRGQMRLALKLDALWSQTSAGKRARGLARMSLASTFSLAHRSVDRILKDNAAYLIETTDGPMDAFWAFFGCRHI